MRHILIGPTERDVGEALRLVESLPAELPILVKWQAIKVFKSFKNKDF